ncbi:PadR family transcriptional regulator [Embleya sp. NPDC020886]|uniref:PadR family transcriptional regulator n=1 Tax=Embleya sp. NPDC020886 TaxID=3363980 RepID=UPI0037BC38BA
MKAPFKITGATLDVLEALLAHRDELHGFAIARAAGKATGSVYPILLRLENAGWVESHWETEHPQEGRPRRRFYRLSGVGLPHAQAIVMERRGQLPNPLPDTDLRPNPVLGLNAGGGAS